MGVFDILFSARRGVPRIFTKIFQKSEKIVIMVTWLRVRSERKVLSGKTYAKWLSG